MKKTIALFPLALLLLLSCKESKYTEQNQMPPIPKAKETTADIDPYFVQSQNTQSPYGPNSITRNMLQDAQGNIWLATWEGIIRYDGKTFTNLTKQDSLREYHAFALLEARNGNLWFGTIGAGTYLFDGKSFQNFTTQQGLIGNEVTQLYQDQANNIWICTATGLSKYDGQSFHNYTSLNGLSDNEVNAMMEAQDGTYWIGTRGRACLFDGKQFTELSKPDSSYFSNVRSIIEDRNGNIWLGGNDGLWQYDGNSLTQISEQFIGYIYEDKKGNIWTSSGDASPTGWRLNRYEAASLSSPKPQATLIRPEIGMLFGIIEDTEGHIWFGHLKGVGRYDGKDFEYFQEGK